MAKKFEDVDANLTGEGGQSGEGKSSWFRRIKKGINTKTSEKKETPEGLWNKCPECGLITVALELEENLHVCPKCNYHFRIGSEEYFQLLFDNGAYTELFSNIRSKDKLGFTDLKPYQKRLEEIWNKTDLTDSMR
ncbi:MAG: acetyl-CoA carboxylase carboxyl transferase subunit beta, partial [Chitinophagaceae bacterium]|nr:acetyl-CoA carboxylase carboxyl transferase subunit beta [Chitinophagaceae bacterium]